MAYYGAGTLYADATARSRCCEPRRTATAWATNTTIEPQRGLPELLPADEKLLWQGSPDWRAMAARAFHLRKLAAVLRADAGAARRSSWPADGASAADALLAALWLLPLAAPWPRPGGAAGLAERRARTVYTSPTSGS